MLRVSQAPKFCQPELNPDQSAVYSLAMKAGDEDFNSYVWRVTPRIESSLS